MWAGDERVAVYDAQGRDTLPGKTVRIEGGPPIADVEVNEAYDGLGATFDFFAAARSLGNGRSETRICVRLSQVS